MNNVTRLARLLALTWPLLLSGCSYFSWLTAASTNMPPAPELFAQMPTTEQLVQTLNEQSSRVQQLEAPSANITAQGFPTSLPAEFYYEQHRRLRLIAKPPIIQSGSILDLGSNDEMFWMFVNDELFGVRMPGTQRTPVFVARHDQFSRSAMHQMLPVEPHWLIETLGLVRLNPNERHEGPFAAGADRLELRSRIPSSQGELTRVLAIHARHGWVMEQRLYDARNQLLATTQATQFQHYPAAGVSLPHHIDIQLSPGQPTQVAFALDVNGYMVNQLTADRSQLWAMPEFAGRPRVDLADPRYQALIGAPAPHMAPQQGPPQQLQPLPQTQQQYPSVGYRPNYRGLEVR